MATTRTIAHCWQNSCVKLGISLARLRATLSKRRELGITQTERAEALPVIKRGPLRLGGRDEVDLQDDGFTHVGHARDTWDVLAKIAAAQFLVRIELRVKTLIENPETRLLED